jgi:hypothetical protein
MKPFAVTASLIASSLLAAAPSAAQFSLRFFGNGAAAPDLDRVKIRLDAPHRPVDVGAGDFTVEWWMKALPGENDTAGCFSGLDNWISGNILFDRDIYGAGDHGDWGVSLVGGQIAFGVADTSGGGGICSATSVDDGVWHHVAVTRRQVDGRLRIWIGGMLEGEGSGPSGNVSYRDGRPTDSPADPFLVLGAEKHDVGLAYPSFSGFVDELRVSTVERYTSSFAVPKAPFANDGATAALYHFDEGAGNTVADSSGAPGGPSHGERRFGGSPAGPLWSTDTPFAGNGDVEPCVAAERTLCLNGDRFAVTVAWNDGRGSQGEGTAVPLTADSGFFWFFRATNIELIIKVLDACGQAPPRFWVFAAGLTNVATTITLQDTESGATKTYERPFGPAFAPILDTNAFATCP